MKIPSSFPKFPKGLSTKEVRQEIQRRLEIMDQMGHASLQFSHFDGYLGVAIRNKSTHEKSPHQEGCDPLGCLLGRIQLSL
jgi:hypothetical protein